MIPANEALKMTNSSPPPARMEDIEAKLNEGINEAALNGEYHVNWFELVSEFGLTTAEEERVRALITEAGYKFGKYYGTIFWSDTDPGR